ncbi:MAG: plasmid partition protein ParG [Janthinobacterium lividum]
MSSKFKMPARGAKDVQGWVNEGATSADAIPTPKEATEAGGRKQARLTIDLPQQLHARFKAACAIKQTPMGEQVTNLIEEWVRKNT